MIWHVYFNFGLINTMNKKYLIWSGLIWYIIYLIWNSMYLCYTKINLFKNLFFYKIFNIYNLILKNMLKDFDTFVIIKHEH